MPHDYTMTATQWGPWIGYEILVAAAVFTKSIFWFRGAVRDFRAALVSWVGLLLLAFFGALALGQWCDTSSLTPLVAFGLASGMIVSAAVNAAYELGTRNGRR